MGVRINPARHHRKAGEIVGRILNGRVNPDDSGALYDQRRVSNQATPAIHQGPGTDCYLLRLEGSREKRSENQSLHEASP